MDSIYTFPKDLPEKPIIQQIKDSAFIPEQKAFITLDGKIRDKDDFWVELYAQFGGGSPGMEIVLNRYINVEEALRFAKELRRITNSFIQFTEEHILKEMNG